MCSRSPPSRRLSSPLMSKWNALFVAQKTVQCQYLSDSSPEPAPVVFLRPQSIHSRSWKLGWHFGRLESTRECSTPLRKFMLSRVCGASIAAIFQIFLVRFELKILFGKPSHGHMTCFLLSFRDHSIRRHRPCGIWNIEEEVFVETHRNAGGAAHSPPFGMRKCIIDSRTSLLVSTGFS